MKLILVRHGETDHNQSNTHIGQSDVPLNDRGLQQAKLVGQRLAAEKINFIYSSDLQRAAVTAKNIATHHPEAKLVHNPLLRERNAGVLTGQPIHPDDDIGNTEKYIDFHKRPTGGESIDDVRVRAEAWLTSAKQQHSDDTLVVVSHGVLLFTLLGVAVEAGAEEVRKQFLLGNTSVTILDVPPEGKVSVIHLNDTTHLKYSE